MAEQEKFKPVGYKTPGWYFRGLFVDDEGNVFKKGKHIPEEKGKHQASRIKDEADQKEKELAEKGKGQAGSDNEKLGLDSRETPVQDFSKNPGGITKEEMDEMVAKLRVTFTEEWAVREKSMREEFNASLAKSDISGAGMSVPDMARAIATAEQYKAGGVFYRDIRDLDPADFDERGAIFTSYGNGYLIVDDVRRGFALPTPYGRIFKFRFTAHKIVKIGRAESYSCYCSFKTYSKKEIEWLRSHTRFGIEFFENVNLALSTNARKAQIAAKVYKMVTSLDQHEIVRRAQSYGIQVGGVLSDIITELSHRMAEEQYKKELAESEERNIGAFEQAHLT